MVAGDYKPLTVERKLEITNHEIARLKDENERLKQIIKRGRK